jgi:O-acetyl-ADP-ribose deacetylase (regulator of RNase III)
MTIKLTTGDLLEQRVDAIVNTVNTVGVMGKGIALQFKRKWPANAKAYEVACKRGEVVPGKMFVFDNGGLVEPKFIINFPTKRHWRQPSRMSDIDAGLVDLIAQIKRLKIRSIAIPPLGCGNGGLDWNEVRPRIEMAFKENPDVDVRLFAPGDIAGVRELAPEAEKPRMTPGRAAILKVLSIYREMRYPLSQVEVQKLAYFLARSGQDLGRLEFKKHTYGPYAGALRHVLIKMDGAYLNGVGDGTKPSEITVVGLALEEAESFLASQLDRETAQRVDRIARLIEGFETPYGMELLATVDWVAMEERSAGYDEILRRVHGWSERKRQIMKPAHVKAAYDRLVGENWIEATSLPM